MKFQINDYIIITDKKLALHGSIFQIEDAFTDPFGFDNYLVTGVDNDGMDWCGVHWYASELEPIAELY